MSWGMDMSSLVRVEAHVPFGEWLFEFAIINHHGWCGNDRFDHDELEMQKFPLWLFNPLLKNDFEGLKKNFMLNHALWLNVARIEKGDYDNCAQDAYYEKEVGDINLYKGAIKRFRRLAVFL